jgi:hypothetical protein
VLDRQFGIGPKLHVVSNGFDAEELGGIQAHPFDHFSLVYTGRLAPPKRVLSPVMAALRRVGEAPPGGRPWKLHYYGHDGHQVLHEAEMVGLARQIVVHGQVPRPQALAAVKGADVAVVITSVEEPATTVDHGMVTAKLFESIGLGTSTLLIAPTESDANAIAEITGLVQGFPATDVEGIASFLRSLMEGHRLEAKDPAAYAWGNLVNGLDQVLRDTVRPGGDHVGG